MAKRISTTHPCVFKGEFIRAQVDPRIKEMWPDAPFGNLRRLWREKHCATLNPYDSAYCPYSEPTCAIAFLLAAQATVIAMPRNRSAYFRTVAHRSALSRAERKPLARESQEGPGDTAGGGGGVQTRWGLRRSDTQPIRVDQLLRSFATRPRQGPPTNGSEGTK